MYARLLLHMLKRGLLELPFTVKPGPGPLKTLPTYMVRPAKTQVLIILDAETTEFCFLVL